MKFGLIMINSCLNKAAPGGLAVSHVSFQGEGAAVLDAAEAKIIDLYITKYWGIKFGTSAACTVLRVDQVSIYNNLLCFGLSTEWELINSEVLF